jgi:hypothetical protein
MSFLYLIDEILTKVFNSIAVLIGFGLVVIAFVIALLVRHRPLAVSMLSCSSSSSPASPWLPWRLRSQISLDDSGGKVG